MAACCSVEKQKIVKDQCPACGVTGKSVVASTLLQQIRFPDNLTIPPATFYYCTSPDCEIGYFANNGITFQRSQLREQEKIKSGWLCYCFDISKADYRTALDNHNAEDIKNFIIQKTKTGTCTCATRNPSGQCCLADFKRFEKNYPNEQR